MTPITMNKVSHIVTGYNWLRNGETNFYWITTCSFIDFEVFTV